MMYCLLVFSELCAVIMSVIYKRSVMRVLSFRVAAYVLLCDLLWSGLVLGFWCGSSGGRIGGGCYGWWVYQGRVKDYVGEYGVNFQCNSLCITVCVVVTVFCIRVKTFYYVELWLFVICIGWWFCNVGGSGWWAGLIVTGGVIFKKSKIVLGDMASFSVWQLMYCCVSVVIRFGTGLVLGSWCGS